MEKVGNTKLREIFNEISGGNEEVEIEKFNQFFRVYLNHFKFPMETTQEKWDDKEALNVQNFFLSEKKKSFLKTKKFSNHFTFPKEKTSIHLNTQVIKSINHSKN